MLSWTTLTSAEDLLSGGGVLVADVPNPRRLHGGWISDPSHALSPPRREALEETLERLKRETGSEVTLVILPSIGNQVPKHFATELFNAWQVGREGVDDGVLILHVLDQRRVEIETGYGVEGILPDALCARLIREQAVPLLRAGKLDAAHSALVGGVAQALRQGKPQTPARRAVHARRAAPPRPTPISPLLIWGGVLAGGLALAGAYVARERALARTRPRMCADCGELMTRLPGDRRDAFLSPQERKEMEIGSLDYDVWRCPQSHHRVEAYDGDRRFKPCPACTRRGYKRVERKVIRQPTEDRAGLIRHTFRCAVCGHEHADVHVLSSLDSDTFPARFSSGGGGHSGGSSSGGSDFGGGRSGGGGAGGSY